MSDYYREEDLERFKDRVNESPKLSGKVMDRYLAGAIPEQAVCLRIT